MTEVGCKFQGTLERQDAIGVQVQEDVGSERGVLWAKTLYRAKSIMKDWDGITLTAEK